MRYLSLSPRLLLPLIMLMGILIIGMRVDDVWNAAAEGHLFSRNALAETKPETPPAETKTAEAKPAETKAPEAAPTPPPAETKPATETEAMPAIHALDDDQSPAEMEILKQLSDRRDTLEKRSRDLDTREGLIKVAEQRVDQKIQSMETLRLQLQSMVNQANEQQQQQLDNLVKIYETMKPDEAAHIFETLDMPTLLGVVLRMKPKSTAPIMAKMAPEKAKDLTIALTKQDQLPQVK